MLRVPEHNHAVLRRAGEEAVGVLKGHGTDFCIVRKHERVATFGALAGAIPDAGVFAAAGREPAAGVVVGEFLHLAFVAAHVEFEIRFRHPEVYARVLVAGDEPFAIGRPDEGVNAIAINELFLCDKIVGIPEAHAAEVGCCEAAACGLPGEG